MHNPLVPSIKEWKVPEASNKKSTFDFGVIASFGYMLPNHVINAMNVAAINMHPSLLPKYGVNE